MKRIFRNDPATGQMSILVINPSDKVSFNEGDVVEINDMFSRITPAGYEPVTPHALYKEIVKGSKLVSDDMLPEDWTGHIQIQGSVDIEGYITPSDTPDFYGVYAKSGDGTYDWIIDYKHEYDAVSMAEILKLRHALRPNPVVQHSANLRIGG